MTCGAARPPRRWTRVPTRRPPTDTCPTPPYARIPCSYPYDTVKALLQASPNAELVLFDDGLGSCEGDILRDNGARGCRDPPRST